MRPTFVLQHLHFLVSLLIHTQAVRKGKFGSDLIVADIKTNMAQDSAEQQILPFTFATARSYFMSNNEKCLFHASFCLPRSLSLAPLDVRGEVDLVGQLADVDLKP